MTSSWEREQDRRQRDLMDRYSDRIKAYDQYWDDLSLHNIVTVSKDDEDKALLQDIKMMRKLLGKT